MATNHRIDVLIAQTIRTEIERAMAPYRSALERISGLVKSRGTLQRLAGRLPTRSPARRKKPTGPVPKDKLCAVISCSRQRVAKGYCLNHYVKRRNLLETKRLPKDWTEGAKPQSVKDLVLVRGGKSA